MTSTIKERPILFSGPMVRAILEGRKTVTRRPVKFPFIDKAIGCELAGNEIGPAEVRNNCPYGVPGQRLWVRETWYCDDFRVQRGPYLKPADMDLDEAREYGALVYAADGLTPYEAEQPVWKPSIHMPRWVCRIQLEITAVRVERLQSISPVQALAEGILRAEDNFGNGPAYCDYGMADLDDTAEWFNDPVLSFQSLWASINGAKSWHANPWVWVVDFKRVTP